MASFAPSAVRAACECGYRDPNTQALWTDATIVYFNETGMQQIVVPNVSPLSIYGDSKTGDTGTGQEAFAVLGDIVNPYENDFGATYRSAFSYNNTYIDQQTPSQGLAMQISPADLKTHIVNSTQIMTRRRDIQFGSFRVMVEHANITQYGGAFSFAVGFNESEVINTGVYLGDLPENSTLRWSYSASGVESNPVKVNLTYVHPQGDSSNASINNLATQGPMEHRMDWISGKLLQFRNDNANQTVSFHAVEKGRNTTNIPTSPAPVSLRVWANGEPSLSQGPPLDQPLVTRIKYVRFFYNSTLHTRNTQFGQQCQITATPICNTEDWTLRDNTPFGTDSLLRVLPIKLHYKVPIWSAIPSALFTAVFIAVIIHGMIVNAGKARARKEAGQTDDGASIHSAATSRLRTPRLRPFGLQQGDELNRKYMATVTDLNEEGGDIPELYHDWVDSDSEYDSEDFDDAEVIDGELEQRRMSRVGRRLSTMLTRRRSSAVPKANNRKSWRQSIFGGFGGNRNQDAGESTFELTAPMPALGRFDSYRFGGPSLTDEADRKETQEGFSRDITKSRGESAADAPRWQQSNAHPTIVNWASRTDATDVGRLARPVSMAPSHRLSIVPVQHSLVYMMFQRARNAIFVGQAAGPKTSTGERRIDYLDGMRGFACLGVSVAHFTLMFYHGISDDNKITMHYIGMEQWIRKLIAPIYINAGLLLGIFFFLPGRTMCQRYLLRGGLGSMADSTIRRIPRLILPVLGATLMNYMMIDVGGYRWIRSLASRTWSTWAYFQNYDNVLTYVNAFITLWWAAPPDSPALLTTYATGVLWTIPLIVQGLWTCMLCALVAHEIKKPWKRFTYYGICVFISWYVNNWDMFFMGGLIIADLDANINYRKWSEKGLPIPFVTGARIKGSLLAWLFFAAALGQQYLLFWPDSPSGDLNMIEYGYHPDFSTSKQHNDNQASMVYHYQDPRVWGWFLVMSIFILADLSTWFQTFWRLRIWAILGNWSMAIYLCHGVVFWTYGAAVQILMLTHGVSYWAATLITFLTSYVLLFTLAIAFTSTWEVWAGLLSKACWRAASGAYGRKI